MKCYQATLAIAIGVKLHHSVISQLMAVTLLQCVVKDFLFAAKSKIAFGARPESQSPIEIP
jgi:hypothetical protein